MKVAFLIEQFPKISETFIMNQVIGLLQRGHDVHVFSLSNSGEEFHHGKVSDFSLTDKTTCLSSPDGLSDGALTAVRLATHHPKMFPEIIRSLQRGVEGGGRISALCQYKSHLQPDWEFDVWHAHFGPIGKRWDFLTTLSDAPYVASFYGQDAASDVPSNPETYSYLFDHADRITVLSEDMLSDLKRNGCPGGKTRLQPLPVDTNEFHPSQANKHSAGSVEIVTVARFVEKKGLDDALAAVDAVSAEHDIHWRIAGDGPLKDRFESELTERGLTDVVETLGLVSQGEIQKLLAKAHVFLLPSKRASSGDKEGTPTVLLEAQAAGVPIISTKHAGIPEIVRDGKSGILVPESDPEALTQALQEFLSIPGRWEEMGQAGRELVHEKHSLQAVAQSLEEHYWAVRDD